jgi:hypothetical protein
LEVVSPAVWLPASEDREGGYGLSGLAVFR